MYLQVWKITTEKLCKGLLFKRSALDAVIFMVSLSLRVNPIDDHINVLPPHVCPSLAAVDTSCHGKYSSKEINYFLGRWRVSGGLWGEEQLRPWRWERQDWAVVVGTAEGHGWEGMEGRGRGSSSQNKVRLADSSWRGKSGKYRLLAASLGSTRQARLASAWQHEAQLAKRRLVNTNNMCHHIGSFCISATW